MVNWKALIPIALAITIAAGGSLFYNWLQAKTLPQQPVTVQGDAIAVAVAVSDLPWGTKIIPEMVKTTPFLKESLPEGSFSNAGVLVGRVTISPLKKNDPITENRLAPADVTTGGVSAIIKPGKRAIAVKGDKVIGISGFIRPQNHVDVLVTIKDPKTDGEVTKLVLENILVLATGVEVEGSGKNEQSPVDVYTLEVTPEEGEKLSLASTRGKLQFALRNVLDTENVLTQGATISGTLSSLRHPEAAAKQADPPKPKKPTIRPRIVTVEVIEDGKLVKKKY